MNAQQLHVLRLRQTDTAGAIYRMNGSEEIYEACLRAFLSDSTLATLDAAVTDGDWDGAFTAAHALKGVAGNMGFVPLMHSTGQLIVLIRGGRMRDIPEGLEKVNSSYRDIIDGIHQYFANSDKRSGSKRA